MTAVKSMAGRKLRPLYADRTIEGICILVSLVGYELAEAEASKLTPAQRHELEVWAERTHLRASDNLVRVPARPAWLPAPWQGAEDTWGRGPTPISAAVAASVDCGGCPRVSTGCQAGKCLNATRSTA